MDQNEEDIGAVGGNKVLTLDYVEEDAIFESGHAEPASPDSMSDSDDEEILQRKIDEMAAKHDELGEKGISQTSLKLKFDKLTNEVGALER